MIGVFLEEARIQEILAEAEEAMTPYVNFNGRGQAEFQISVHILNGTK